MTSSDWLLLCFIVGSLWSLASFLLGGLHLGHTGHVGGGGHVSGHVGHGHSPHSHTAGTWLSSFLHPSAIAAFLAWFGGVGYLLTRHTGWQLGLDLALATIAGVSGAICLGSFLRFLQSREQPLNPADYDMVGVLGKVASPIRPDGVGEVIYIRDGARKPVPARSEEGASIGRGEEVVVTRWVNGTAYVRTWVAMLAQSPHTTSDPGENTRPKENERVQ